MRQLSRVSRRVSLALWFGGWLCAAEPPPGARRLCDPEDAAEKCPGPACRCSKETLAVVFPATGDSFLRGIDLPPGTSFETFIVLDNSTMSPLNGWSYGVRHDPRFLRLDSVTVKGTAAEELGQFGLIVTEMRDIEECEDIPRCSRKREGAGFISAVVTVELGQLALPGPIHGPIARATYTILQDPSLAGTLVEITHRLHKIGSPPADINLMENGISVSPQWVVDGLIGRGRGGPLFHRGDVDGDGKATIGDALDLLTYIFRRGPKPGCMESGDVNDSGGINVTDGILLLQWLFAGGPPPAAPGPPPAPCGTDPEASPSSLGCAVESGC